MVYIEPEFKGEKDMGCPDIYYIKTLQTFAHSLVYMENGKLAKQMLNEKSVRKLENFVLDKKSSYDESKFFFNAGRAAQQVLNDADEEGCDALNASIGGLVEFEYFIGLRNNNDDTE